MAGRIHLLRKGSWLELGIMVPESGCKLEESLSASSRHRPTDSPAVQAAREASPRREETVGIPVSHQLY